MHAVSAHELEIRQSGLEVAPDGFHLLYPSVVVHGVGFGHADDCTILDFLHPGQPKLLDLPLCQLDQIAVRTGPQVIILEYEIFHAQAGFIGVWNHRRRPILEVLNAPDANACLTARCTSSGAGGSMAPTNSRIGMELMK